MSKETSKEETIEKREEEVVEQQEGGTVVSTVVEAPMGFEDEEAGEMIIPRVKVIQSLSPERKAKPPTAEEGDIINSLTGEKYNNKKFIPVFKFNNNIWWRLRSEGGGINCIARDGKCGQMSDGTNLLCTACKKNEFDNSKTGADALPKCNKYINFFGFFEGEQIPVILSFAKTNYNEGKKMFSLAKVTMQNMWNYGYSLHSVLRSKNNNEWYIIDNKAAGPTTSEERAYAASLYQNFRNMNDLKFDMDDGSTADVSSSAVPTDTEY